MHPFHEFKPSVIQRTAFRNPKQIQIFIYDYSYTVNTLVYK